MQYYQGDTQEDEAKYIADTILKGYASGVKLKDFAVLYRNHALSNSVEAAFQRGGIPYRVISGLRFFDRAEVKDMLSYLWVLNNPADTLRLQRIINTPARKIGAKAQETMQELAQRENMSVFSVAERAKQFPELARSAEAIQAFADMMNGLIEQKFDLPLPEFYDLLLEKSGYLADLQRQNNEEANGRIDNILELRRKKYLIGIGFRICRRNTGSRRHFSLAGLSEYSDETCIKLRSKEKSADRT